MLLVQCCELGCAESNRYSRQLRTQRRYGWADSIEQCDHVSLLGAHMEQHHTVCATVDDGMWVEWCRSGSSASATYYWASVVGA